MMITVTLYTSDKLEVVKLSMPPFHELPRVVVWGSRVFELGVPTEPNYFEAFTWWAPPGTEVA